MRKGNRGHLLQLVRQKVASDGYCFKKGHSRSKMYGQGDSISETPKRLKLDEHMRKQRSDELTEEIGDVTKRVSVKESRCEQAQTVHQYKLCDELSEQIMELKQYKREKERELAFILKKDKRSKKYFKKLATSAPKMSRTSSPFSPPSRPLRSATSSLHSLSISTSPFTSSQVFSS